MDFFSTDVEPHFPDDSGRRRTIFIVMFLLHAAAIFVPLLLLTLGWFKSSAPEVLTVNLVDTPSVGPKVAPITTRLPPSEKPTPDAAPAPDVPEPQPSLPEFVPQPDVQLPAPPVRAVDQPSVRLPAPKPRPKLTREPKLASNSIPRPPQKKRPSPSNVPQSRQLTNTKKVGRTGSNRNELVPIGKDDLAQVFGKVPSNTPQGGPKNTSDYTATLLAFLKIHWSNYSPSRAELGGTEKIEGRISLNIGGDGRIISSSLTRSSGNARMDDAIRRMLQNLTRMPAPADGKAIRLDDIIIEAKSE